MRKKKDRDGSFLPCKTVFLIRHGESRGQTANKNGLNRRTSAELIDAGLTRKGEEQARAIPKLLNVADVQLVVSSPLSRALHTALLAFPGPIMVHYGIYELGGDIPENRPRSVSAVKSALGHCPRLDEVDFETLRPKNWRASANDRDQIAQFFTWLAQEREESSIAVICHYNVIRAALGPNIRPTNACPIECELSVDGTLRIK